MNVIIIIILLQAQLIEAVRKALSIFPCCNLSNPPTLDCKLREFSFQLSTEDLSKDEISSVLKSEMVFNSSVSVSMVVFHPSTEEPPSSTFLTRMEIIVLTGLSVIALLLVALIVFILYRYSRYAIMVENNDYRTHWHSKWAS